MSDAAALSGRPLRIDLVEFMPSGGMFQFAFHLGEALALAGHQVTLLTGPRPELTSTVTGFTVLPVFPTWHPNEGLDRARTFRRVRRLARAARLLESWRRLVVRSRREKPDVVHLGEFRFVLDSVGATALARLGGAGIVADTAHNPLPYDVSSAASVEKSDPLTLRTLRSAYSSMDVVFALGEGPAAQLVENFPALKPVICGHGEYGAFAAGVKMNPPSHAGQQVLFFGSWTRYKNLGLLLDSFALVRERAPEARLVMAGPVMDDVDLDDVRARAARVPGVELRPGYVAIEDVPRLFDAARVVALPYEVVNVSGVVHLAYTFGRPVVATDVGAMRDVVRQGETGLLAGPGPEAFAGALLQLLAEPEEADRLGKQGQEFVEQSSSWTEVSAAVVAGYRAAL